MTGNKRKTDIGGHVIKRSAVRQCLHTTSWFQRTCS